jgi:hypothetical protein
MFAFGPSGGNGLYIGEFQCMSPSIIDVCFELPAGSQA